MKFAPLCLFFTSIALVAACNSEGPRAAEPSSKAATAPPSDAKAEPGAAEADKSPEGPAYLLRLIDYRNGARLELVNPAHTTPVNQYSKVRVDASRKVTDAAWMTGLVRYLEDEGWAKEEKRGSAPTMAKDALRWSLEMDGPKGTSFIAAGMDTKGSQLTRLLKLKDAFVATYNATLGFQAVRSDPDKLPFKVPEFPPPSKKGGKQPR